MKFFRTFFRRFAFDLGSDATRIWVEDQGVVLEEPTCLVLSQSGEVLATGTEAVEIAGRQNREVQVVWPIQAGGVVDEAALLALLKVWLRPYFKPSFLLQPTVLVAVPAESTVANRALIRSIFEKLGAVEVITIAQPLAAAIGIGVHTADATGSFYFHLGHGLVEAGVVSLGSIMVSHQSHLAGQLLAEQMRLQLQNEYDLLVDDAIVAKLKQKVFSFIPDSERKIMVTGKSAETQRPVETEVTAAHFSPVATLFLSEYVELLYQVLQDSVPALLVDSLDKGLLLSGGLAQLHGLDRALANEFKMPVSVVEDPALAVIQGQGQVMNHLAEFRQSLSYHTEQV